MSVSSRLTPSRVSWSRASISRCTPLSGAQRPPARLRSEPQHVHAVADGVDSSGHLGQTGSRPCCHELGNGCDCINGGQITPQELAIELRELILMNMNDHLHAGNCALEEPSELHLLRQMDDVRSASGEVPRNL